MGGHRGLYHIWKYEKFLLFLFCFKRYLPVELLSWPGWSEWPHETDFLLSLSWLQYSENINWGLLNWAILLSWRFVKFPFDWFKNKNEPIMGRISRVRGEDGGVMCDNETLHRSIDLIELYPMVQLSSIFLHGKYFFYKLSLYAPCTLDQGVEVNTVWSLCQTASCKTAWQWYICAPLCASAITCLIGLMCCAITYYPAV